MAALRHEGRDCITFGAKSRYALRVRLDANDTIAALSSAPQSTCHGTPGRAIIRLSGAQALTAADAVFKTDPPLAARTPTAGWKRVDGSLNWRKQAWLAQAYVMPGPRSYTRQHVVELHLPAVRPLLFETLEMLLRHGVRAAEPGEFTRRALLHGRISLAQAEAVGALLRAGNAADARQWAARAARDASPRSQLREALEDLLALAELGLDFSHEDVDVLRREELLARICQLQSLAENLATQAATGAGLQQVLEPRVALTGTTNAGKSSLFNALLNRPAALVSAEQHTTRDTVPARCRPGADQEVQLTDTAGLDETLAAGTLSLEQAQSSAARAIREADILLVALDASLPHAQQTARAQALADALGQILQHRKPAALAVVWTKLDLAPGAAIPELAADLFSAEANATRLLTSAVTGMGIPELQAYLARQAQILSGRMAATNAAGRAVAREAAARCASALRQARMALESGLGEDAAVVELREAAHALAQSEGALLRHDALTEALLDRIFAAFCIGK